MFFRTAEEPGDLIVVMLNVSRGANFARSARGIG